MSTLRPGKQTRDDRPLVYARIETEPDGRSRRLSGWTFGTIPAAYLDRDVVRAARRADGAVALAEIDGYFEARIREAFTDRPLEAFVTEFTERTPYSAAQAAVIVTCGWFEMDRTEAIRAINQFLRDPYDDVTAEWFADRLAEARQTRALMQHAERFPFGL